MNSGYVEREREGKPGRGRSGEREVEGGERERGRDLEGLRCWFYALVCKGAWEVLCKEPLAFKI
jgi:hypothetical protein